MYDFRLILNLIHRADNNDFHSMDDHYLASLVASTPSRCILLLEDIDCAFPSREDDDDDDEPTDANGNPVSSGHSRSEVTLSGLLNVLDSVTSEEGRITFATVCASMALQLDN